MPRFSVTLPIAGFAVLEVDAFNESEAIAQAFESVSIEHIETWDAYKKICEGNVLRAPLNSIEVEMIEDDES